MTKDYVALFSHQKGRVFGDMTRDRDMGQDDAGMLSQETG
jgi:hypothetical protein